jgi:ABC-type sugar transport system ATPase subunit
MKKKLFSSQIKNIKTFPHFLQNSFTTLINPELSRVRTIDTRVLVSLNNCRFKSDDRGVFGFDLSKGEILGVTGKHMKTLVLAVLGQNECKEGIFRQRGSVAYNSEDAFIFIGSIKVRIFVSHRKN